MDRHEIDVTLRPGRLDEVDLLAALVTRSWNDAGLPQVFTADELAEEWDGVATDPATDARVAVVGGEPVGVTWVHHRPSGQRLERAEIFGEVEPASRGLGVGSALVEWAIGRATARLRERDETLPRTVFLGALDTRTDVRALAEANAMTPRRWFEDLIRPLEPALRVPATDGVVIADWDPSRMDEVRIVRNGAFADHWGATENSPEAWAAYVGSTTTRTDLGALALDRTTGSVLGYLVGARYPWDDELTGRREGWIQHLGVSRSHRGRGIASALIADATRRFADDGLTHAALGVDAASPTGASRLYRSHGFETLRTIVLFGLDV